MRLFPTTWIVLWLAYVVPQSTEAQAGPASAPEPAEGSDTQAGSPSEPEQPTGAPAPPPAPPAATQAPPPAAQAPPPAASQGPPPPAAEPARAEPPGRMYAAAGTDYRESEPGEDKGGGFDMPPFSFRIDPLNWVIEGRLGLELEVGIWKFISLELVPVFVVSSQPPILDVMGQPDNVSQSSNGLGPISGTSIGVGFWLKGEALEGTVLRVMFTNYGYTYESEDDGILIDEVSFTERRIYGMFGSHNNYGPFTIATGIGLGIELNSKQRCFVEEEDYHVARPHTSDCPDEDEQHIAWSTDGPEVDKVYDLNGWLHPAYLHARIALGFVFDL